MELEQKDNNAGRFSFSYDKGSWYDHEGNPVFHNYSTGGKTFYFVYYNKEELNFCDFIEAIKENLLKHFTKNRGFIFAKDSRKKYIKFSICCDNRRDDTYDYRFSHKAYVNFGVNGICANAFVKDLLKSANKKFEATSFDEHKCYRGKKFNVTNFDKKFIVDSLSVSMQLNQNKVLHKEKFYKKLHDEIVAAVWQPWRYLDFEEFRALKERWPQSK